VPGTGIQLNNMLGEYDLVSGGRPAPPGRRLTSMMSPSIVLGPAGLRSPRWDDPHSLVSAAILAPDDLCLLTKVPVVNLRVGRSCLRHPFRHATRAIGDRHVRSVPGSGIHPLRLR